MSIVSKFAHKLVKNPITQGIGHAVDVGSNFLPPGFRDAGHVVGGLMQNKNLKSSLISAGESYLGGKVMGALGSKFGAKLPGGGAPGIPHPDISALDGATSSIVGKYGGQAGSDAINNSISKGISDRFGGAAKTALSAGASALAGGGGGGGGGYNPNANTGRTSTATQSGGESGGGGGFDWGKILGSPGVAEAGLGLAGSALAGYGQGKIADADRAWDKDKFGQTLGEQKDEFGKTLAEKQGEFARSQIVPEGDAAQTAQSRIDSAPVRDRAMAMLSARMGAPQSSFVPHDIFNPSYGSGPAQMGGVDQNQMNAANAAYKPGQGGVTTGVQQALLKKLGYA